MTLLSRTICLSVGLALVRTRRRATPAPQAERGGACSARTRAYFSRAPTASRVALSKAQRQQQVRIEVVTGKEGSGSHPQGRGPQSGVKTCPFFTVTNGTTACLTRRLSPSTS